MNSALPSVLTTDESPRTLLRDTLLLIVSLICCAVVAFVFLLPRESALPAVRPGPLSPAAEVASRPVNLEERHAAPAAASAVRSGEDRFVETGAETGVDSDIGTEDRVSDEIAINDRIRKKAGPSPPPLAPVTVQNLAAGEAEDSPVQNVSVKPDAPGTEIPTLATVTGRVVDRHGSPVPGATVKLYSPSVGKRYRAVTGRAGDYTIAELVTAEDYRWLVKPNDYYQDYRGQNIAITGESLSLDVVLDSLDYGGLSGRIVDASGAAVPDFDLLLRGRHAPRRQYRISSDETGHYWIDHIPHGPLVVESRSQPLLAIRGIELSETGRKRVDLIVDRGDRELHGQLLDSRGRPVPTAKISLNWSLHKDSLRSRSMRHTVTDEEGFFRFGELGPGPHQIRVNAPAYHGAVHEQDVSSETGKLVIRLAERDRN